MLSNFLIGVPAPGLAPVTRADTAAAFEAGTPLHSVSLENGPNFHAPTREILPAAPSAFPGALPEQISPISGHFSEFSEFRTIDPMDPSSVPDLLLPHALHLGMNRQSQTSRDLIGIQENDRVNPAFPGMDVD